MNIRAKFAAVAAVVVVGLTGCQVTNTGGFERGTLNLFEGLSYRGCFPHEEGGEFTLSGSASTAFVACCPVSRSSILANTFTMEDGRVFNNESVRVNRNGCDNDSDRSRSRNVDEDPGTDNPGTSNPGTDNPGQGGPSTGCTGCGETDGRGGRVEVVPFKNSAGQTEYAMIAPAMQAA